LYFVIEIHFKSNYSNTVSDAVYYNTHIIVCLCMLLSSCVDVLLSEEENREIHRRCVEQYDHLRDEFERYKLRAQSVLRNKSPATQKVYITV